MKIIANIFQFIISPFTVLFNADFKGIEFKHKWINIVIYVLISLLITALIVYLSHKALEIIELRK